MDATDYLNGVSGMALRYLACLTLRQYRRPLTVGGLVSAIEADGWAIAGQPNKTLADALRWELKKKRIIRVGRGRYAYGRVPRSTEWWMRNELVRIRSALFACTLADADAVIRELRCESGAAARGCRPMVVERMDTGAGAICAEILPTLPTWFGIAEANDAYVKAADANTTFVAFDDSGRAVGLTTITRFGDYSAEVHLMAVLPDLHRSGIGRQMLSAAEEWLRAASVEYLQVKTLSASASDEGYAKTRKFYAAVGFRELEEFPELWDPSNPALQLIKRL
ncbi:MAG: hypothetical protein QOF21_3034 [Actinomycetota bacterium]|jgi:GNAT superfamily N-acetyltransferase